MATETIKLMLTSAEALASINRQPAGTRFYVHVRCELPVIDDDAKCFPGSTVVRLTRPAAMRVVRDLLAKSFEDRGARMPCSVYTDSSRGRTYRAYYIG